MKYSQLPFRFQLLAIVLFLAIMGMWAWLVHAAVYDWLPQWFINYFAVAMIAFCVGFLLGEKSATREINRHRDEDSAPSYFE